MKSPNMIVLYIENMSLSRAFYSRLFGLEPVQASDGFTLYLLEGGFKFALWAVQAVVPATAVTGGGVEIDFSVEAREEVDALYRNWSERGARFAQHPGDQKFVGYTFIALDPDGHRLRVILPEG